MSSLWTPGGERPVGDDESPGAGPAPGAAQPGMSGEGGEPSPEELAAAKEQLRKVREEVTQTPVADIVANHAIGLWQLAVIHLGLDRSTEEPTEPNLAEARVAIDAMAGLVEGAGQRLGEHTEPLAAALQNLQMAFVQLSQGEGPEAGPDEGAGAGESGEEE